MAKKEEFSLLKANDGNSFSIIGYVINAMKKSGMTKEDIKKYQSDAMSDSREHLLCVSQQMIDKLNN